MFYNESAVEEVRQRTDIVDIISGYVQLKKKGANHFGLCPFHSEKSPSFSVSQSKQMYHCFGCGAGGNVFTFLMEYEHYSFREALEVLAERAGVTLSKEETSAERKKEESRRAQLLAVCREAAKYFYYQLRNPQGELGYRYLTGRALSEETLNRFGLGYSLQYSDDLTKYLRQKGYSTEIIAEAGLCSIDEKHGPHDKFWNRVMFPIQDINHRVIGFGGRVMGDAKPKYLNSPETPIFDKSRNLFGLNFARSSRSGYFILCEGYMDVIALHQAGFTQAVASLGTAFTSGQASLVKRYVPDVILAYDSDEAGVKAAVRAIQILRESGISARVLSMQPFKDPDEFIKNRGREEFQKRIDEAENGFMFRVRMLEREFNLSDPDSRTRFFQQVSAFLCEFPEELERDNYTGAVAAAYNTEPEKLGRMVAGHALRTGDVARAARPVSTHNRKEEVKGDRAQRLLLTWLTDSPGLFDEVKKYVSPQDFTDETCRRAAEKLYDNIEKTGSADAASVIGIFEEPEKQSEVAAILSAVIPEPETQAARQQAIKDILLAIKTESYEYYSGQMGNDLEALTRAIEGKRALEELRNSMPAANL